MNTRSFIFLSFFLTGLQVIGQINDSSRFTFSLSAGAGVPFGNFGQSDSLELTKSSKYQAFAKTGYNYNISADFRITKHFGAMIRYGRNINEFNSRTQTDPSLPNVSWNFSGTDNVINSVFIGPIFYSKIKNKLHIEAHALCGETVIYYSQINQSPGNPYASSSFPSPTHTFKPDATTSIGFDVGLNIKWKFTKHFGLTFGTDYLTSTQVVSGYTWTTNLYSSYPPNMPSGPYFGHENIKESVSLSLININLGIIFYNLGQND